MFVWANNKSLGLHIYVEYFDHFSTQWRFLKGGCNVTSCVVCISNEVEYLDKDEGDQKIVLSFVVEATSNLSIE